VLESVDAEESCGCMVTLILTSSGAPIVFQAYQAKRKRKVSAGRYPLVSLLAFCRPSFLSNSF
jgi:hypothetical protein